MNLTEWKTSGDYFDFESHPIFYRFDKNENEVLLCLHGFPSASFDYHKIWKGLSEKFSVLSFDLIGYGFSAKPTEFDYTTFRQTDVLEKLIEYLKIEKLHILAHDYGNTITQELLARSEEKRLKFSIETICFLNGALFPETHRPIAAQKLLISPLGFLFGRFITDSKFKKSLASVFGKNTQPAMGELDEFLSLFKYNDGRRIAHKLIRYMTERAKYRERWIGALKEMKQPFCFINGLSDPVSGAHLVRRFREVLPERKNIIELENIGHFPHFESPQTVLERFLEFHEKS